MYNELYTCMLIGSMDILFIVHGPAFLTNLAVLAFLKVKNIDKTIVYISSEAINL